MMLDKKIQIPIRIAHILLDILVIIFSTIIAFFLRFDLDISSINSIEFAFIYFNKIPVVLLIWMVSLSSFGLYGTKKLALIDKLEAIIKGCVLGALILVTLSFYTRDLYNPTNYLYSRKVILYFTSISIILLSIAEILINKFNLYLIEKNGTRKRALVIGEGRVGAAVLDRLEKYPALGYKVVGLVEDGRSNKVPGYEAIGSIEELPRLINRYRADEVIMAMPSAPPEEVLDIISTCNKDKVAFKILPNLYEILITDVNMFDLDGIPLLGLEEIGIKGPQLFLKRVTDIVLSAIGLIIMAPLMLLAAIAIKLDSPGPVFFKQQRAGKGGKPFPVYKFRTMVVNAEELLDKLIDIDKLEEPVFKVKNDPRVTRVGEILRKTSIDELPQLFNILKGDMSIVGPRPEEVRLVDRYDPWQRKRIAIKPGLTGPMQVNGRGDMPLEERVKMEIYYIQHYSFLRDIAIMLKTVLVVLFGRGAY